MNDLAALRGLSPGSVFRRADLHVHTPASRDIDPRWATAKPAELVRHAIKNGLEIIAVTDHNSAEWCDPVRKAATRKTLLVFPGVEVSTSEGHLIAIFDPDAPASAIRQFLIRIGIREHDFGNLETIAEGDLVSVAAMVEREGGIAIAAHVDREKGFWNMMKRSGVRRQQIHACPDIRALELVDPELRQDFLNGSVPGYPRRLACVQGSDCFPSGAVQHQLDAVGSRHCYLSMDEVSLSGLRQALLDPDARVRFAGDPMRTPDLAIEGLWVSDGFLAGQKFRFNSNLTCLIGGTGSGKSLTVELLRFALDQQVDDKVLPPIAAEVRRLLGFALHDLDAVNVLVRKGEERYLVQRSWLPTGAPPPRVSRVLEDSVEPIDEPMHLPIFFTIKGFSQSEIIEYARVPLARLSLVDDLIDVAEDSDAAERAKAELRRNAADIIEVLKQLAQAEAKLKDLPAVQEEIKRLSDFFKHPRVKAHDAWYAEQAILDRIGEALVSFETGIPQDFPSLEAPLIQDGDLPEETPSATLMEQLTDLESEFRLSIDAARTNLAERVRGIRERFESIRATWDGRFEKADRAYRRLVAKLDTQSQGQAGLHEKLRGLRRKEQRLNQAEGQIKATLRPRLEDLEKRRDELLRSLQGARSAATAKRRTKADELTAQLSRQVVLRIRPGKSVDKFKDALLELRIGSRVQEADIAVMAERLHPVPLVKSLLAEQFETPGGKSDLAPELFRRLWENVLERDLLAELYELQLVDLEDILEINFALDDGSYRDLEALAHGQKCTAVLMIALVEGDFPLLVDQPEDALHAPWIEEYIVPGLRSRRGSRQCIFGTRSPNILVSANAEQVIALKADAQHGRIERTGAIDRFDTRDLVLYHVEGGKGPFRRRQETYDLEHPLSL